MSTRIPIADLLPNTNYALRIRAKNGPDVSEWSNQLVFATITDTVLPSTPTGVTWAVVGDGFQATWTTVTTNVNGDIIPVTRYEVELVANSITKIVSVPQVTGDAVKFDLSFEQNLAFFGGTPQPAVALRVRAVDNKDLKSVYTSTSNATNPAPGNPTGFAATGGTGTIDLVWTPPTDKDLIGYNVYLPGPTLIWSGNVTRFTLQTSTYTSQTFTVKAVDKYNQESTGASASGTATSPFTIDVTAPGIPTKGTGTITTDADAALTTYLDVAWTLASPPSDLAGYQVRYRKSTSGDYSYVNVDDATLSARIRGLEPYVNYEWSVQAFDFYGNYSGFSANATATGASNGTPSQPAAPTVSASTMNVQVTVTGNKQAGGAMEADVNYYEIYASTTTGFTPAAASQIGQIAVGPAMIGSFQIPTSGSTSTQTWFVKIIAVDKGGLKSTASPQATSTPGLIDSTNIVDLAVTNAKINSLAVDKLTAGTLGAIAITARATLQIGDAANNGIIQSYEYVNTSGVSGWQFTKNGLVIKSGSISSPALLIQDSTNIVSPEYASFESPNPVVTNTGGVMIVAANLNPRYGLRSLGTLWGTLGSNPVLYLGSSVTDYNVPFESGETYIVSVYTFSAGAVSTNVQLKVKFSDGSTQTIATGTNSSGGTPATATRLQGTVVAPVNNGIIFVESSTLTNLAGYNLDGLQVERKQAGLSTASSWKPPGMTRVDGGIIRTGAILSTANAQVWDTSLNPIGASVTVGITNTSTTVTSAGLFVFTDVGKSITGTGIQVGTTITAVATSSSATLSLAATATNASLAATIYRTTAGGYKVDSTTPAWSINTTGAAQFGDANVRGSLVVGPTSTTGNDASTITATNQSFMASSTYVPGSAGWILRADGGAEFRAVAVGSFNGNAVAKNTLAADSIAGGTITSVITLASAMETTQQQVAMKFNTTNTSNVVAATTGQFYADDLGVTVSIPNVAPGATIIEVTNSTSIKVSVNASATASSQDGFIYRGRKVRISGSDGIKFFNAAGATIIELPTDPSRSASFTGAIRTSDLYVSNNFRMEGTGNSVNQGGILSLAAANFVPTQAPSITFDWANTLLLDPLGNPQNPSTNPYINNPNSFLWDNTGGRFVMMSEFFGTYTTLFNSSYVQTNNYSMSIPFLWNDGEVAYGGVTLDHANNIFYFLTQRKGYTDWYVEQMTRAEFNNGVTGVATAAAYNEDFDGTSWSGTPGIAARSSVLYIARINNIGQLSIQRFSNFAALATGHSYVAYYNGFGAGARIVSVNVGQFDYGTGSTYVVVSAMLPNGTVFNWVFRDTGSAFVAEDGMHFPAPNSEPIIGVTWKGTGPDDSTGHFETLTQAGKIYTHTPLGKSNTATSVTAKQQWRDGTTAIGTAGPVSSPVGYQRRSRMTLFSVQDVPNLTTPNPSGVTFSAAVGAGSMFIYFDPANGTSQPVAGKRFITVTDFQGSNATVPGSALPSGTPGQINSASGLYIGGDGHLITPGTGWQNASFNATWANYTGAATFQPAQYKRVGNRVSLRGLVQSSAPTVGSSIFTLPSGFRVSTNKDRVFAQVGNGALARVDVMASGAVQFVLGNAAYLSLDGIEFDID